MGNTDGSGKDWTDLADAITLLRRQIAEAQARIADPQGPGDNGLRFGLEEVTVELGMELGRTNGADGGLRFSVLGVAVNAGGKHERADKATHKVTLRLTPQQAGGHPVEVRDRG